LTIIKQIFSTFPQVAKSFACGKEEKTNNCQNYPQAPELSTGFPQSAVEIKTCIHNKLSRFSTFPQALLLLLDKYNDFKLIRDSKKQTLFEVKIQELS